MKRNTGFLTAAVLVAGISSNAMAQSHMQHQSTDPASTQKMKTEAASESASTKAFKETHMKMIKDMDITYSGNSDADFVRGMIPHHQGAIDMAKVQLQYGKNAQMRRMAAGIIKDQEREIAQMQAWLKKNVK